MHQSGQLRPQSMQTVQFSSLRAMTPRARGAGSSFTCGYCTVAAPLDGFGIGLRKPPGKMVLVISLKVTPRPLTTPGTLGIKPSPLRGEARAKTIWLHAGGGCGGQRLLPEPPAVERSGFAGRSTR